MSMLLAPGIRRIEVPLGERLLCRCTSQLSQFPEYQMSDYA